jgi:lysophospholipase L1-like esterase
MHKHSIGKHISIDAPSAGRQIPTCPKRVISQRLPLLAGIVVAVVGFGMGGNAAAQAVPAKKADAPMVFADPAKDPTKPAVGGVKWFWPTHARNFERRKAGNIDLVFLGDSITQGWPGDLFGKYYGSMKAVNFGCGGDKIQNLLMRLEGDDGELKGTSPKVIVLLIGINNMEDNTDAEIAYGVDNMLKRLGQECPKAKVLLLGILPTKGTQNDKIKSTNALIAKLDNGKNIRFLDMGPKFLDRDGKVTDDLLGDEVHLTPKGYEIWAKTMNPLLKQMMREDGATLKR